MKNIVHKIKLSVWILLALFVTTSCDSWLDVKPKTEEEAERMFSTEEGFKSALAGAYISLSQPVLYGRELTFGMVGILGQEWGGGGTLDQSSSAYSFFLRYRYDETVSKAIVEKVWGEMYKTIANVNTLLEYTEKKRDVLRGNNYEIIRGEALALRAFIHFDLLRLYAEADFSETAGLSIPYVKEAKPAIAPQYTPAGVVELVLGDIKDALDLLEKDPIYTGQDVSGEDNGYLANRNFHLNYYAVQGLKARVLAYAKQMDKAAEAALVVIGAQENKDIFPWVKKNDINPSDVTLKDRTFSTEHLFALNTIKLDENIKGYFKETMSPMLPRQAITSGSDYLYDVADYRLKWFDNENGLINVFSKFWQSDKKTVDGIVLPKRDRMPMIRISEMYYIVAESMKISDPQGALDKLNLVRKMRGLTELLADLNPDAIQQEIQKEYEREFLGEGQLFFFHKRQGTRNIATANAVYKLPIPDLEIDLGERE